MNRKRVGLILGVLLVVAAACALYEAVRPRPNVLTLTGIVTTDDVVVGPQVPGQLERLLVHQGDPVKKDQLLAVIQPAELEADRAYYSHSAKSYASQVEESAAALRFQELETATQIRQAEANLAAAEAQKAEAAANLDDAHLTFERQDRLVKHGAAAEQDFDHARTAYEAARARLDSLGRQVDAQRAALELARANGEQVAVRRGALLASQQQSDAAEAERAKADVRLSYAEVHAPIAGVVDVRAARTGEYLNPGQAIVTLIDPDDLWVRVDVEETYVDRIRLGERFTVRLPSGEERVGTVFYRGVDAGFATQRDVSRTKRDIKTFEVRLRVDNADRHLAVGMTAYLLFPVGR
ncbi:MAG TPA: efflux RND transporter periplasmic adaptor subunit [Anaeromyxobacteraceae bacterium]|nr:efflux RND transporter periplasmic adaptor subunit [Anaeromyxobacteraceae bacterium]